MCGRFILFDGPGELEIRNRIEETGRKYGENIMIKAGEIFPTDVFPVLTCSDGVKGIGLFKWGFPNYKGGQVVINARSETLTEKSMFKGPFMSHRCLVPASAFFEWKQVDGKKKKYIIRSQEAELFYMAGLYEGFIDKNGHAFTGFVIITAPAGAKMSALHDRMPVILTDRDEMNRWLDNEAGDVAELKAMLRPSDNITIEET